MCGHGRLRVLINFASRFFRVDLPSTMLEKS